MEQGADLVCIDRKLPGSEKFYKLPKEWPLENSLFRCMLRSVMFECDNIQLSAQWKIHTKTNTIEKEIERVIFALSERRRSTHTHAYKPDKFEHLHIRNGWYFIYPGGIFISSVVSVIFSLFSFCLHAFWWMVFVDHQRKSKRERERECSSTQQWSSNLAFIYKF